MSPQGLWDTTFSRHSEETLTPEASFPALLRGKAGKQIAEGYVQRKDTFQVFLNDLGWRLEPSKP